MKYIWAAITVTAWLLTGCASQPSLDGQWTYRSPAGQDAQLEISSLEKETIYIRGDKILLTGVYMRKGKYLMMQNPDNPRGEGFKLKIVNKSQLIVVEEPATPTTGQKHVSGVLYRKY